MTQEEINELQNEMRQAIRSGDDDAFLRLLQEHPEQLQAKTVFGTWLHFAASKGRLEIVKQLLAVGCPIDGRGGVHDSSAIHLAASGGHYDVVKYLLDAGASLDTTEPERNPLFGAIYGGHAVVARLLIDGGIDTAVSYTGKNMRGVDAIAFAKEWGRTDIVEMLEAEANK